MPNVLSSRDLVSRSDNMDETVISSCKGQSKVMPMDTLWELPDIYNGISKQNSNRSCLIILNKNCLISVY